MGWGTAKVTSSMWPQKRVKGSRMLDLLVAVPVESGWLVRCHDV